MGVSRGYRVKGECFAWQRLEQSCVQERKCQWRERSQRTYDKRE